MIMEILSVQKSSLKSNFAALIEHNFGLCELVVRFDCPLAKSLSLLCMQRILSSILHINWKSDLFLLQAAAMWLHCLVRTTDLSPCCYNVLFLQIKVTH